MNDSNSALPGWQTLLARLLLLAAVLAAAATLAAALGVWIGAWNFRAGFGVLGVANIAALCIAVASLLAAVLLFALGRGKAGRLVSLSLLAALVAGLAWAVPQSYRPADGTPPIHDISTDTVNPPDFVAVLPLRADAPNSTVYGDSPNMTAEKLAKLQQQAYPDIQTRRLDAPAAEIFDRALAAVDELGWELVDQDPAAGRIEATDTTFWFRFKDDVVIRIREENGQTLLDVRSVSRVGTSDVGKNAARIREFFAAL